MKCPFIYSNGKQCTGYINEIKYIKADLILSLTESNQIIEIDLVPHYHIHLLCSEKGNHTGYGRKDSEQMKIWELPADIKLQIKNSVSKSLANR